MPLICAAPVEAWRTELTCRSAFDLLRFEPLRLKAARQFALVVEETVVRLQRRQKRSDLMGDLVRVLDAEVMRETFGIEVALARDENRSGPTLPPDLINP